MTMNATYMQGFVVSSNIDGPAPSSSITYTISVNLPNGTTDEYQNVRPRGMSFSDYFPSIDVVALSPGEPVSVVELGSELIVFARPEFPMVVSCDGTPILGTPLLIEDPLYPGTFIPAPTPGTDGSTFVGSIGVGGSTSTGTIGGGGGGKVPA